MHCFTYLHMYGCYTQSDKTDFEGGKIYQVKCHAPHWQTILNIRWFQINTSVYGSGLRGHWCFSVVWILWRREEYDLCSYCNFCDFLLLLCLLFLCHEGHVPVSLFMSIQQTSLQKIIGLFLWWEKVLWWVGRLVYLLALETYIWSWGQWFVWIQLGGMMTLCYVHTSHRSLDKEICETMCIASELCCYSPSSLRTDFPNSRCLFSPSFVLRIPSPGLPEVGTNARARGGHLQVPVLTLQCGQSWLELLSAGLRLS